MKTYIDKSVQEINRDINKEMWQFSVLEFDNDLKSIKAWLNVLVNYFTDIINSKFNGNSKLDISLSYNHFLDEAANYAKTAIDKIYVLYKNKKTWESIKFSNDMINQIDIFERKALQLIAWLCKNYFTTSSNWTLTFTNKVNPLKISDVVRWNWEYEIDYTGCTNEQIKSKIYTITWWSYTCKLRCNSGTYFLVDSKWNKIGNALIWEWVQIKNAWTKSATNTPRTTSSSNWWWQGRTTVERNQHSGEYLIWPRIKASNNNEIWWLWNSIMNWFQWYDSKSNFPYMDGISWSTTTTHRNKFKSESDVKAYVKNHSGIKSFMFYFGVNTTDNNQTLSDIEKRWNWLKNEWIQPVLCTCIWYNKPKWRHLVALNESLKTLGSEKWWPVVDFARAYGDEKIVISKDWLHPTAEYYNNMANIVRSNFS